MSVIVYNKNTEDHNGENSFYIGRGSCFGNPFTHIKDRETKAMVVVSDRDQAIDLYEPYFDKMYEQDEEFKKEFDKIFEMYQSGKDVFLACYCKPDRCHGDILEKKLIQFSMKEKIKRALENRKINI